MKFIKVAGLSVIAVLALSFITVFNSSAATTTYSTPPNNKGEVFTYELDDVALTAKLTGYTGSGSGDPYYRVNIVNTVNVTDSTGAAVTYTVKSVGDNAFSGNTNILEIAFQNNTGNSQVTSIGAGAFSDCKRLETVSIPWRVTSIGAGAFDGCTNLKEINVVGTGSTKYFNNGSDGVLYEKTVNEMTLLKYPEGKPDLAYTIPPAVAGTNVTGIDPGAFKKSKITEITFGDNITKIPQGLFDGCTNLTTINMGGGIKTIDSNAFKGSDNKAYDTLTSITIGPKVETIGNGAFMGFINLKSIEIPANVKEIGVSAFEGCVLLENITFAPDTGSGPRNLKKISDRAFYGCEKLGSVTPYYVEIPENVSEIGADVFTGCKSLTSIKVASGNTNFKNGEEAGVDPTLPISSTNPVDPSTKVNPDVLFQQSSSANNSTLFLYPEGIKNDTYTIPNDVQIIGSGAFKNTLLKTINIPKSVADIKPGAFVNCINLGIINVEPNDVYPSYYSEDGVLFVQDKAQYVEMQDVPVMVIDPVTGLEVPKTVFVYDKKTGKQLYYIDPTDPGNDPDDPTKITTDPTSGDPVTRMVYEKKPVTVTGPKPVRLVKCPEMKSGVYTIPDTVTLIEESAFENNSKLTQIIITNSVDEIKPRAFYNCKSLNIVEINANVKGITAETFFGCDVLQNIKVGANNELYSSVGGVLFNKDKTTLIKYPQNKSGTSYTVPESVTGIGRYAFDGCSQLTNIILPSGLTDIYDYAFSNCKKLREITFKSAVPPNFGDGVFDGSSSISKINVPNGSGDAYDDALKDLGLNSGKVIPNPTPDPNVKASKAALSSAISAAKTKMKGVDPIPEVMLPSELPKGKKYAVSSDYNDLLDAINSGNSVLNKTNATQAELDAAKEAVLSATKSFTVILGTNAAIQDPDRLALGIAIEKANLAKNGVIVSPETDASKLDSGKSYISQVYMDALNDAIKDAQTLYKKADASATELKNMKTNLDNSVATFKNNIITGTKTTAASKSALKTSIDSANSALNSTAVLPTGKTAGDLAKGKNYAAQKDIDALNKAVVTAQAVYDKADAKEADITKAKTDLDKAIDTFKKAVITGTNSAVSTATPEGGKGLISPSAVKPSILKSTDATSVRGLTKIMLPYYSILVTANLSGEINGYVPFKITADQLKSSRLSYDKVKLFYVSDDGEITEESRKITRDTDGGITLNLTHFSLYVVSEVPPKKCTPYLALQALKQTLKGFIRNVDIEEYDYNHDKKISTKDALLILKASMQ